MEVLASIYVYHGITLEHYPNEENKPVERLLSDGLAWIRRRENRLMIGATIYSVKRISLADNDTVIVYSLTRSRYVPVDEVEVAISPRYDGILLEKMQTKHVIGVMRRIRRKQLSLVCSCCGEVLGFDDKYMYDHYEKEISILKEELKKRPNLPTGKERKEIRKNRAKNKRDGGSHHKKG